MKGSIIPLTLATLPLAAMQTDDRPATELASFLEIILSILLSLKVCSFVFHYIKVSKCPSFAPTFFPGRATFPFFPSL